MTYEYCLRAKKQKVCPGPKWVAVGTETSVTLQRLAASTIYYWQVRAVNTGGTTEADAGVWWSFTTLKAPPTSSSQSFRTSEDTPLTDQLKARSSYSETFSIVGDLPVGQLDFHGDGSFTYIPVENYNGQVTFQFIVSDGYNLPTIPYSATISITPVDDPPVLSPIPDQVVTAGDLLTFTVAATDPDIPYGDSLTYSIVGPLSSGAAIDSDTGLFSWATQDTLTPGVYTFEVKVTDSGKPRLSDSKTVRIVVIPGVPIPVGYLFYLPVILH